MSELSPINKCPNCGGVMPAKAPEGLCPKCLFLGVASPTESGAGQPRPAAPALDAVAAAFPQLEILELIGQGGMGCVFKARQPQLNRFVALKILPEALAQDAAFAARFAREAQALAALSHPNIVTVHDSGQSGGFFYLLMEFVDGANLRQALRAGRFTPEQALAIVPPICDALQFAHEHGIVHRDIKPENVLLDKAGRVKIADFGIAKMVGGNGGALTPSLSPSGGEPDSQAAGTPHYVAPEQKDHPRHTDHRADIYSLGVVFYEMLTGELPARQLEPPSRKVQIDVRLDDIVLRALEKSPELRWQTAAELRTQVETIATSRETGGGAAPAAPVGASPGGKVRGGVSGGAPETRPDSRALSDTCLRTSFAGVLLLCLPSALFAWFVVVGHRRSLGIDLDTDVQLWTGLIGFPLSAGFGTLLAWLTGSFRGLNRIAATDAPRRWSDRTLAAVLLLVVSVLLMGGGMVMFALAGQDTDWNPSSGELIFVLIFCGGGLLAAISATLVGLSARRQIRREPQRLRGWGGAFAAAWFWPGVAVGLLALSLPVLIFADRHEASPPLANASRKSGLAVRGTATNAVRETADATPRTVVDEWLSWVKAGRTEEMWSLTTRESGGAGSVDLKNTWQFDKIKAHTLAFNDQLAMVVTTRYRDNAGQDRMIVFSLVKRDGRWLIRENAATTPDGAESRLEGFTAHPGVKYDVRSEDIVGRWTEAFFSPATYRFAADGRFSMSFRVVGGSRTNLQGTWRLEEDRLTYSTGAGSTTGRVVRVREDFFQLEFPEGNQNGFHRTDGAATGAKLLNQGPGLASNVTAPPGNGFGSVIDRVFPFGVPCRMQYLQFHTGNIIPIGSGPGDTSDHTVEFMEADKSGGIDASVEGWGGGIQLVGRGCVFVRAENPRDWETLTGEKTVLRLRRESWLNGVIQIDKKDFPATCLFKSASGDRGILQIVGFTENPRGVKIRYKLVQDAVASSAIPRPTVDPSPPATLDSLPPVVVRTEPASGARDVAPGIVEVRVGFSKEMAAGSWSWTEAWTNSTPAVLDGPRYDRDLRTCVVKVKLEPGRTYAWWLNSEKFGNFKDKDSHPAVPYLLIFQTRGKEGSP